MKKIVSLCICIFLLTGCIKIAERKESVTTNDNKNISAVMDGIKKATEIDAWQISIDSTHKPGLIDSKIGGIPYWDTELEYPKDAAGNKLCLLAQINLADLGENEIFPSSGLLQFFIGTDDIYGMDFEQYDSGRGSRIIYHSNLKPISEEDVLALNIPVSTDKELMFPVMGEFAIRLNQRKVSMSPMDFRYDEYARKTPKELCTEISEDNSLQSLIGDEAFWDLCGEAHGHWLPGYPYFTQEDPRYMEQYAKYDRMLLQIDSEGEGIMWGDAGVGAFFLTEENLRNLNFDEFLYNWDCG